MIYLEMGPTVIAAVGAFLFFTLLLVGIILFAKAKLSPSGAITLNINDGEKTMEVEGGGIVRDVSETIRADGSSKGNGWESQHRRYQQDDRELPKSESTSVFSSASSFHPGHHNYPLETMVKLTFG